MAAPVNIIDPRGKFMARVTSFGQLVTAPLQYSTPVEREMSAPGVVYNFVTPSQDKNIVITDIVVSADKSVNNTTPADIIIFEADEVDSDIPNNCIIRPQLLRGDNFVLSGLNLLVRKGKWVNAMTSDATVIVTIMFYKIPVDRFV
jgi:hypothetical protein